MNNTLKKEIERDNRAEIQRVETGLAARDWALVLGAVILVAAIFGFIVYKDAVPYEQRTAVEPAAGTATTTPETDNEASTTGAQTGTTPYNESTPSTYTDDASGGITTENEPPAVE